MRTVAIVAAGAAVVGSVSATSHIHHQHAQLHENVARDDAWSEWNSTESASTTTTTTKPVAAATTTTTSGWGAWGTSSSSSTTMPVAAATTTTTSGWGAWGTTSSSTTSTKASTTTSKKHPKGDTTSVSSSTEEIWGDWTTTTTTTTTTPADPWADWTTTTSTTTTPADPWVDWTTTTSTQHHPAGSTTTSKAASSSSTSTEVWEEWSTTDPATSTTTAAAETWSDWSEGETTVTLSLESTLTKTKYISALSTSSASSTGSSTGSSAGSSTWAHWTERTTSSAPVAASSVKSFTPVAAISVISETVVPLGSGSTSASAVCLVEILTSYGAPTWYPTPAGADTTSSTTKPVAVATTSSATSSTPAWAWTTSSASAGKSSTTSSSSTTTTSVGGGWAWGSASTSTSPAAATTTTSVGGGWAWGSASSSTSSSTSPAAATTTTKADGGWAWESASSSTSTSTTPAAATTTTSVGGGWAWGSASSSTASATTTSSAAKSTGKSSGGSGISANGNSWALTYSPYTSSGGCKDASTVASDLTVIAQKGFSSVRIYSTDCSSLENIGTAARTNGLKLILGVWISSTGISGAQGQVSDIVAWGQFDLVELIVVGNEAVFNGYCSASELATFVSSSSAAFKAGGYTGLVTLTEPLSVWQETSAASEFCAVVDVIGANLYAFFNADVTADKAGSFIQSEIDILNTVCSNKPVYVLESGWPHAGECNGVACPSPENQKTALKGIQNTVGAVVSFLSYEDEPWKEAGEFGVEQYWGCADVF